MLWFKAWRESRVRFAAMALVLAWACAAVVAMQSTLRAHSDEPLTYYSFVWNAVYKGTVRDMFVILGMMLGLGGLAHERATGTAGFTLALPVTRGRLIITRALVGFLEIAALASVPAVLLPALSGLAGESYPAAQSMRFGLLWAAGGSIPFAATLLLSVLLAGEYSPWVVSIAALTVYMVIIHIAPLSGFPDLDFLRLMNGSGYSWFRATDATLLGPLPWMAIAVMALVAAGFVSAAERLTARRDFS